MNKSEFIYIFMIIELVLYEFSAHWKSVHETLNSKYELESDEGEML